MVLLPLAVCGSDNAVFYNQETITKGQIMFSPQADQIRKPASEYSSYEAFMAWWRAHGQMAAEWSHHTPESIAERAWEAANEWRDKSNESA